MSDGDPLSSSSTSLPILLVGLAGSPGLAIGRAVVIDTRRPGVARRHIPKHLVDEELARFDRAVETAAQGLRETADRVRTAQAGRAEISILEAYILMVEDESLRDEVERHVRIDHQCAEWALDNAIRAMADQLRNSEDAYLAERSHDIEFIGDRILRALTGQVRSALPESSEPTVVIAHDLSPAETAGFSRERVKAIVTELGTRTSHTSIIARALEIPAVVGVKDVTAKVGNGDLVIVDGHRGQVTLSPTKDMVKESRARAERQREHARGLREERDRAAFTRCVTEIDLLANIELPTEAQIALDLGARGIGLYRTEFVYVDRADLPSEDEQYELYRRVLETVSPRPVTLRTFDIGGDKFVSAFQVPPDMNPALGLRAVRLGLARPEIFMVQLRAMIRASAHGDLRVMVPMIASLDELRATRGLFDRAIAELDRAHVARAKHVPLGVMIEVPAAAIMSDVIAREAEFLSVGTNDLVQYTLAVDRGSPGLAYLATPFDPAILQLMSGFVASGARHRREVSVCGSMASDPFAAILLIGMGLRNLSLEAAAIPKVKAAIGRFTLSEAREVATDALRLATAREVDDLVKQSFGPRLADLLDED